MDWFDLLFLINLGCVFFSGYVAIGCFKRSDNIAGWFNVFASSLNAAVFANHFI